MTNLLHPMYVDNIMVQILSYLSNNEIIQSSIWSHYHYYLIRHYHWDNTMVTHNITHFTHTLALFNFRHIVLPEIGDNIDVDNFSLSEKEKIKYTNFTFFYNHNYLSLLKYLSKNTNNIKIKILNQDEFTCIPNIFTCIEYDGSDFSLRISAPNIKSLLMIAHDQTIIDALITQCDQCDPKFLSSFFSPDVALQPNQTITPNIQKLIMRSVGTDFFRFCDERHINFITTIEQIYSFDQKKIQEIEQDVNTIRYLSDTFLWCEPMAHNDQITWVNLPITIDASREYNIWSNSYNSNYLSDICNYYEYDLHETMQYFHKLSENSFELFFRWFSATPLRNTSVGPFLLLNMYQTIRHYLPDMLDDYVMQCVKLNLPSDRIVNQQMINSVLCACVNNRKIDTVESALEKILNVNTALFNDIALTIHCIWYRIVANNDVNAFYSLRAFFVWNIFSNEISTHRKFLAITVPLISLFKLYLTVPIEIMTLIVRDAIDASTNEIIAKLCYYGYNPTKLIGKIINDLLHHNMFEHLDLWVKLMKVLCKSKWKHVVKNIYGTVLFDHHTKKEALHWCIKNEFSVRINKSLESQCMIIAYQYDDISLWSRYLTIKAHSIDAKILCTMLKKIRYTKKQINLLNFWHYLGRRIDKSYHLFIDTVSSWGSIELLDWWKNKSLPFYYTREAFDGACRNNYIDVVTWWIVNTRDQKQPTKHPNRIQSGGYFRDNMWHNTKDMIILYSDASLFVPNPMIYKIWKHHKFQVHSCDHIKNELIKQSKTEKATELLDWLLESKN